MTPSGLLLALSLMAHAMNSVEDASKPPAGGEGGLPGPFPALLGPGDVRMLLQEVSDPASLDKRLEPWRKLPAYQAISLADYLLPLLLDRGPCETRGYHWEKGTHDLNRGAGRAARGMEALLGTKLTSVKLDSTPEELRDNYEAARKALEVKRTEALRQAARPGVERSVEALRSRYQGLIKPGIKGPDAPKYHRALAQLFLEWHPLGKRMSDLERILGAKATREREAVSYVFDTGHGGWQYQFETKDGVIQSVLLVSLE